MRVGRGLTLLGACLVAMGCDGLLERPGHDFSVRVLDESPIAAIGQIFAPVRFAVDGCGAFDLALEDREGARRPLDFEARPDGTLVASVPVAWMRESTFFCRVPPASNETAPGTLIATCRDAGRSARAGFSLAPRLAGGWTTSQGDIRAVFPSDHPGYPGHISTNAYSGEIYLPGSVFLTGEWAPALNPGVYANPLVRPRMARRGGRVFVTVGCDAVAGCAQVSIGPGESAPGERLADLVPEAFAYLPPRGLAHVSRNVIDMAFAEDGSLIVVTDTSIARGQQEGTGVDDRAARWGETIVWRVIPAPEGAQGTVEDEATVIARLPGETVVSRLSRTSGGALAFATAAYFGVYAPNISVNLQVVNGSTVTRTYTASSHVGCGQEAGCLVRLSERKFLNSGIYLSPDGTSLIVASIPRLAPGSIDEWFWWVDTGSAELDWQVFGRSIDPFSSPFNPVKLRERVYSDSANGGAAWLPGAVALWTGGDIQYPDQTPGPSRVQVFEADPPRTLRFDYEVDALPGATRPPVLVDVIVVNDRLVLTTTTGVRILDSNGDLLGGADPFHCGALVTAAAEQVGPTTVAVGVGNTMIMFEVGP